MNSTAQLESFHNKLTKRIRSTLAGVARSQKNFKMAIMLKKAYHRRINNETNRQINVKQKDHYY